MKKLEDYGYRVTNIAPSRHAALGKAIKGKGYSKVISALQRRKRNAGKNYKKNRFRADINWLREKR